MDFKDFQLSSEILHGLEDAGYRQCTPVQQESLEACLVAGRDVYAQSQTGTGKTAGYLVPVLSLLTTNNSDRQREGLAMVLIPTRELAAQVEKEARLIGKYLSLKIVQVFGGVGYAKQQRAIADRPDLIIATPGRLTDLVNQGIVNLQKVKILVVDEADRMFDMGFQNEILALIRKMPSPSNRRTLLFSATLNAKVGNLVWQYMSNPVDIVIKSEQVAVNAVEQEIYHVSRNEKFPLLLALIQTYKPRNLIIFSNTKVGAVRIADFLKSMNLRCGVLEGNMPQNKRTRVINSLLAGDLSILSATDVVARGLHVPNLDWVLNFDLPNEAENYVHRIGRTARAGCSGKAISFACERYVFNLSAIERLIGQKIPVAWPDKEFQTLLTDLSKQIRSLRRDRPVGESSHFSQPRDYSSQSRDRSSQPRDYSSQSRDRSSQSRDRFSQPREGFRPRSSKGKMRIGSFDDGFSRKSSQDGSQKNHPSSTYSSPKVKSFTGMVVKENGKPYEGILGKKKTSLLDSDVVKKSLYLTRRPQAGVQNVQDLTKIEDRLAYYSEKYGEKFPSSHISRGRLCKSSMLKVSHESDETQQDKKQFFTGIRKLFRR